MSGTVPLDVLISSYLGNTQGKHNHPWLSGVFIKSIGLDSQERLIILDAAKGEGKVWSLQSRGNVLLTATSECTSKGAYKNRKAFSARGWRKILWVQGYIKGDGDTPLSSDHLHLWGTQSRDCCSHHSLLPHCHTPSQSSPFHHRQYGFHQGVYI